MVTLLCAGSESVIPQDDVNGCVGAANETQRSAIAQ